MLCMKVLMQAPPTWPMTNGDFNPGTICSWHCGPMGSLWEHGDR
jgi:hypothetical protein